ncbi:MAG TPA: phosphoribosylanthranilate isomerase [Gemmatimonadaceae bacterium]|nr:phosphoribosylanthranilate isomerase [Gemmatimonadaceae bacterium]
MAPEVKFCGLTRPEDAREAARLGAAYAGVIFAGGPRLIDAERASLVLAGADGAVRRVGVFAAQGVAEIAGVVSAVPLDVVQLHAARTPQELDELRRHTAAELWAVVRVGDGGLPDDFAALAAAADGVVIDSLVAGQLGGTGVTGDWAALARALDHLTRPRRLVLAGGLRPDNVQRAVRTVAPDVVDVSSGVEVRPGVKDPDKMTAFVAALRGADADQSQTA